MSKNVYSIHTFELRRDLKPKEYKKMRDDLYNRATNEYRAFDFGRQCNFCKFEERGIRVVLKKHDKKPYLALIINPQIVLDNGNYVDLIPSADEFERAYKTADRMVREFLGDKFALDKLTLCRADFSVNVNVGSRENVKTYIKLLNDKTGVRKGYRIVGRKCKKYDKEKGYIIDNKNLGISFSVYDKEAQLKDIGKPEQAANAKHILRIEYQLKRHGAVKEFAGEEGTNLDKLLRLIYTSHVFIYNMMRSVVMDCTYYTLDRAKSIVKSRIENNKLQQRMLDWLCYASDKHSVQLGQKALVKNNSKISPRYINKMVQAFEDIDVNIVTLSRKYNIQEMKSIIKYL